MLLLEDYAGAVSELTAINQYFYHHLVFEDKYEDLAELEECISIIEMMHLELLGETILMLGVDPKYRK
jgi:bacterioferritin